MKTVTVSRKILLFLSLFFCFIAKINAQVQPVGTVLGNQTVISTPINQSGSQQTQSLIYYPDDYFKPGNANKRYPLFVFLHGAGEGTGNNISQVLNTSLPQMISQGLKPYGIDSLTGDTIKFIVVSPHAANTSYSYAYGHVKWIIPYLTSTYRVDTSCIWVGGLSAGGRGTWSMISEDTAFSRKLAGIVPISALGYEAGKWPVLDSSIKRGVACFSVCGALDAHVATARAYNDTIVKYIGANNPRRYWKYEVPGADHNSLAWNPLFQLSNRYFNPNKNMWDLMANIRRTAATAPTLTANAGNSQTVTLPANSTTLTGTYVSLLGIPILSVGWERVSGPNTPGITSPSAASTTVTGLVQGTYVFKFTVTNILGAVALSQTQVVVNAAAPLNPVVNAGDDQSVTLPASQASLTGSATTPNGTTINGYAWTKTSGPSSYAFSSATTASTDVTGLTQGTYVFRLTVTNNTAASAYDEVSVVVGNAANTPPLANAGNNQTITLPTSTVTLAGTASDPGGSVASTVWSKRSGGVATIVTPSSLTTNVTGLTQGTYVFTLTVTDNNGAITTDDIEVVVNPVSTGRYVKEVIPAEYKVLFLSSDSTAHAVYFENTTKMTQLLPDTAKFTKGYGGLYQVAVLDKWGNAYETLSGTKTLRKVEVDTLGNPFTGNHEVGGYFFTYLTVRADSAIWMWGNDDYNFLPGTNPITRPIKISPDGMKVKKIATGNELIILTTNGEVWEWAKFAAAPVKKTIPRPAIDVFSSHTGFYGCLIPDAGASTDMGYPYGWGMEGRYLGIPTSVPTATPTALKSYWNLSMPIKYIAANHNTVHYIDSLGRMFGMGDNASGEVGNGQELINHAEIYPTPYVWNWQKVGLMVNTPVQIAPGVTFTKLWKGNSYAFYTYAIASNNDLYSWGRNKSWTLGNGIQVTNEAAYPNALDVLTPTKVTPLSLTCRFYSFVPYTVNAGADQNITNSTTTLTGTATPSTMSTTPSTSNLTYPITAYNWRKLSGGSANISTPNAAVTDVTGLVQGVYTFEFKITDGQTGTKTDTVRVTVGNVANLAPTADAGADKSITLPLNTVTVIGSGNDPDGTIAAYQWTKVEGPATFSIVTPTLAQTTINGLVAGVYKFELRVTDNLGAFGRDTVTITVNAAPNVAPTVNAGTDKTITLPINTVTLTGVANDPDGTIASYQWTKIAGPTLFAIVTAGQAQTVVNNLVQGVYQFELRVTDNQGATAKDTVAVTVNAAIPPPNQAPTANAGSNQSIVLPINTVTLVGSGSDQDGTIASYQWTKIAGPTSFAIASPTQAQTVVNNLVQGVYQFELRVTDNQGATGKDTVSVTVNPAAPGNISPTANAGLDQTITLPINSVTVNGTGNDPDGTIAGYQWHKIAGPVQYTIATPSQAQTTINNLTQGVYQFELVVTDNQGATGKDTIVITVNAAIPVNQAPVVNAGLDQTITLPINSVTLTGSTTDVDGTIVGFQWAAISGPGQYTILSPAQSQTSITNLVQGVYRFELRATDDDGAVGKDTIVITVNAAIPPPPNQAPVANAGLDKIITLPINSVTVIGYGTDVDGTIVSYQWNKIAGPAQYNIAFPTQAQTIINNLVQGTYQFELTVTDNQGATGKSIMTVLVYPAAVQPPPITVNQPPVAQAGTDLEITLPVNTVTLTGSGTDIDGTIASYSWKKISGPAANAIQSPTSAITVINDLEEGVYVFELTVVDDKGASGKDLVQVTVKPDPRTQSEASIFPNPATDRINVKIDAITQRANTTIRIFDMRGMIVYQEQLVRTQQVVIRPIDISKLAKGMYVMKIDVDLNNTQSVKFVKQ